MTDSGSDGFEPSDDVKSLVLKLFCSIREKNDDEISEMSEIYDRISDDSQLKSSNWPSVKDVDECLKDNKNYPYRYLYREMWYRHLDSLSLSQRLACFSNYRRVFRILYHSVFYQLPKRWLWDMVDGFLNQFQSYWLYQGSKLEQEDNLESKIEELKLNDEGLFVYKRAVNDQVKLKRKREQDDNLESETEELNDDAWSVFMVIDLLQRIKEKTSIDKILQLKKDGIETVTAATDDYDGYWPESIASKILGYFTKVGLFRVHCLLGNYETGLNCLLPVDITTSQQGFYTSVIDCHFTTVFHYGFAKLMLHMNVEAIYELNKFLVYVSNTQMKSPQILNKIEKMYALLAICISLCPLFGVIDENVNSQLMQKYGEKILKMQRYDEESKVLLRDLLSYVWPTFSEIPFAPCSGAPRQLYESRYYYDIKKLALIYPIFFKSDGSRYDQAHLILNKVDAVVDDLMFKKLR